jgi:hypothetical protein
MIDPDTLKNGDRFYIVTESGIWKFIVKRPCGYDKYGLIETTAGYCLSKSQYRLFTNFWMVWAYALQKGHPTVLYHEEKEDAKASEAGS